VSDGVEIPVCARCGLAAFPPHLACSRCGSFAWRTERAKRGVTEEIAPLRRAVGRDPEARPVVIGSIRTTLGPVVVGRLEGLVRCGDEVELRTEGRVLWARRTEAVA
jgi:uncharacterized OB-fold protein